MGLREKLIAGGLVFQGKLKGQSGKGGMVREGVRKDKALNAHSLSIY